MDIEQVTQKTLALWIIFTTYHIQDVLLLASERLSGTGNLPLMQLWTMVRDQARQSIF